METQFNDAASSIMLLGLSNDVVTVEILIRSKYIEKVCYDTLDLQLPGNVTVR